MTPKEKAIELYEKYYYTFPPFDGEGEFEHNLSKKCAIICVDEIIKTRISGNEFFYNWDEVKKEIEKL